MVELAISMLGGFSLAINGRPPSGVLSDKGRALIAYLAIESDRPHRRSTLATLLWPDHPDIASQANLRQTLHRVLQALRNSNKSPPYLLVTHQDIQFNLYSNCRLDIDEFSQLLKTCQPQSQSIVNICKDCLVNIQTAVDLYHGDLLAGFSLPGCSDFEWWLTCRQEEYHVKVIGLLKSLVSYFELEHNFNQAIYYAQKAIELEPWSESLHRKKMFVLACDNQRIAALRQYELCRQILARELGVEPTLETTTLYLEITSAAFSAG